MPGDIITQFLGMAIVGVGACLAAVALWVMTTRRRVRQELETLRHELRVSNGAAYNVGELVVRLQESVAALEGEQPAAGPDVTADVDELAGYGLDQSELSVSETQLLDRLREARVH